MKNKKKYVPIIAWYNLNFINSINHLKKIYKNIFLKTTYKILKLNKVAKNEYEYYHINK